MIAWLCLLIVVGALSVPLVHEAGHALLALAGGGRRVRLERHALGFSTSAELPGGVWPRRLFYAGGPLANLLTALSLWSVRDVVSADGGLFVLTLGVALAHLTFALVNLLPLAGHDGRALFGPAPQPPDD